MESLENNTANEAFKLQLRAREIINYAELARERYEHHKKAAQFYLRRTAALLALNVVSGSVTLFGGPKAFLVASIVSTLVLLLRKVDGSLATHLQATIEYKMSLDELESVEETNGMAHAISQFEERCQRFES
jgi:hypothetical protein